MRRLTVFALVYIVAGLFSWWRANPSSIQYGYYWGSLLDPLMYALTEFPLDAMGNNLVLIFPYLILSDLFSGAFPEVLLFLTHSGPVFASVLVGISSSSRRGFKIALGWFVLLMLFWVVSATNPISFGF